MMDTYFDCFHGYLKEIIEDLEVDGTVLDIGCSDARYTRLFNNGRRHVIGTDISGQIYRPARLLLKKIQEINDIDCPLDVDAFAKEVKIEDPDIVYWYLKVLERLGAIELLSKDKRDPSIRIKNPSFFGPIDFVLLDGTRLPFMDNSIDTIVSFDVIEHIENDIDFLLEILRVLKVGGKVVLGTPNRNRLSNTLKKVFGKRVEYPLTIGKIEIDGSLFDHVHVREYTKDEIVPLVKSLKYISTNITPIWIGLRIKEDMIEIGKIEFPKFLERFSHYLMISASKGEEK